MEELVFVTGLPRSGNTLICDLLGKHKDITSNAYSPLNQILQGMKNSWSNNPLLLNQLDNNPGSAYKKLEKATKEFMFAYSDNKTKITIDNNDEWLSNIEFVRSLIPNFKMIICLRDPRSIFASIEEDHRKTLLLNFSDDLDSDNVDNRANALFKDEGAIGSRLKAINNLKDIPDIIPHLFFFRYEDFLENPQKTIDSLFEWLGLKTQKIDFDKTEQNDFYYETKFSYKAKSKLETANTLNTVSVSPRILNEIISRYNWFYKTYYPEVLTPPIEINNVSQIPEALQQTQAPQGNKVSVEEQVANEIDEVLETENNKKAKNYDKKNNKK